ncbi:MAG: S-layer homology domain-containing protein [Clostridia bacterium]|nr:S-layer homology domain-containing protein [Clostridia bacterium]
MRALRRLIPFILAILLVATAASGVLQAAAFYYGQWVGIGTVKSASTQTIASGITYDSITLTDTSGSSQAIKTLTFNPKTSDYVPLVYVNYSGYGGTTYNSAVAAENIGYDVKGAVNASFFSFTGASCNTYGGVNISDGKILQGNNSHGANWMLAFNSDGTAQLVYSRVAFSMVAKGGAWSAAVDYVNICPETTYGGIYYYDEFCGSKTDTKAAGVEVVFQKQNGTQLTVGGTLQGKVTAVRSNVSSGGTIGAGNFVLYASNSSSYASYLRGLAVGDTVEITASETLSGAKTAMENCNSAFVTYGYHIVSNGVNVTSSNGLGESFNTASAQRSAIGIKADGTVMLMVSSGRTGSYPGLTVYELADFLISQGCVTAINLDGGGSTQMTIESGGSLSAVFSSTRRVANSILVVKRPTVSSADRSTLSSLISQATALVNNYVLSGNSAYLTSALSYANGVYNSSRSMPGDYTKAIMRLRDGIGGVTATGYRTGIFKLNSAQSLLSSASASASAVATVPSGKSLTVTQVSGNYGYTKYLGNWGWIDLTKTTGLGAAANTKAVITAPSVAYKGQNITINWTSPAGASGFTYKVIELVGEPDPTSSSEGDNALLLASGNTVNALSVTVPASSRTDGKWLKVAVCVEYPAGSAWSTAYIQTSELPFTDIPIGYWGYNPVKHCYESGYFAGTSADKFSPDNSMTRAMLAAVVYRMAGQPASEGNVTLPFTDVPSNAWYLSGVEWCYANDIVTGTSATTFSPDASITREQAAVFLYRLAVSMGLDTTVNDLTVVNSFGDAASISPYAQTAMAWAVEKGIMGGNNNLLSPKSNATRVQIAQMIYKFDTVLK